jgi:hypothetical protein
LLLTTNDGVTTCSIITSTSIVKVATIKVMILKHVPPLIGLTNLVVTTCRSICSNTKVNDVAHVALILAPISKDTKTGGSYLKLEKWFSRLVIPIGKYVHQLWPIPCSPGFTPL